MFLTLCGGNEGGESVYVSGAEVYMAVTVIVKYRRDGVTYGRLSDLVLLSLVRFLFSLLNIFFLGPSHILRSLFSILLFLASFFLALLWFFFFFFFVAIYQ